MLARNAVFALLASAPLAASLAAGTRPARFPRAATTFACRAAERCAPPVATEAVARFDDVDGPDVVGHSTYQSALPPLIQKLSEAQEAGLGSAALLLATAISLSLANSPATAKGWLALWDTHLGPAIGAHQLTLRGWINEGLMAVFFFIVGAARPRSGIRRLRASHSHNVP